MIKELQHWTVYVHPNQSYLGRGIFILKRHATHSALTDAEKAELARAREAYVGLIQTDFKPDLLEEHWSEEHAAFEIIPRYKSFRIQNGAEFNDTQFGKSWKPAPPWAIEHAAGAFVTRMLVMRFRQPFLTIS